MKPLLPVKTLDAIHRLERMAADGEEELRKSGDVAFFAGYFDSFVKTFFGVIENEIRVLAIPS